MNKNVVSRSFSLSLSLSCSQGFFIRYEKCFSCFRLYDSQNCETIVEVISFKRAKQQTSLQQRQATAFKFCCNQF